MKLRLMMLLVTLTLGLVSGCSNNSMWSGFDNTMESNDFGDQPVNSDDQFMANSQSAYGDASTADDVSGSYSGQSQYSEGESTSEHHYRSEGASSGGGGGGAAEVPFAASRKPGAENVGGASS